MRFWIGGPRIFGRRTGISFGPEDFRRWQRQSRPSTSNFAAAPKQRSFVYVIRSDQGVKVGISSDPLARLASLQTAAMQPLELVYTCVPESNDGYAVEQAAHAILSQRRMNGEWFACDADAAVGAISAAAFRLNMPIVQIPVDKVALVIQIAEAQDRAPRSLNMNTSRPPVLHGWWIKSILLTSGPPLLLATLAAVPQPTGGRAIILIGATSIWIILAFALYAARLVWHGISWSRAEALDH